MAGVKRSRLVVITVSAGTKMPLLPVDMQRYAVVFLPSKIGDYVVGNGEMVNNDDGFCINLGAGGTEFCADRHGSRVKEDWFVVSSAGVTKIPVLIVDD